MPYQSSHTDTIARLILARGQALAEGQRRGSDAWAGATQAIAQQGGATLRDLANYEIDKPRRELAQAQTAHTLKDLKSDEQIADLARTAPPNPKTGGPDYATIAKGAQRIDPKKAVEWWSRASDEEKLGLARDKERATEVAQTAGAILEADPAHRPELYALARNEFITRGHYTEGQIPADYNEGWLKEKFTSAATISQQIEHAEKLVDQDIERKKAGLPKDQNFANVQLVGPDKKPYDALFENNSGSYFTTDKQPITGKVQRYEKPDAPRTREIRTLNPDGTESIKIVPDVAGASYTSAARPSAAGADDPELPRGVVDYIGKLREKVNPKTKQPYTYEEAQQDLAATWPQLRQDHPRVDVVKADNALRSVFRPAPGSGASALAEVMAMMRGETPAGTGAPASPPSPPQPTVASDIPVDTGPPAVTPPKPAAAAPARAAAPKDFSVTDNPDKSVTVVAPDGSRVRFPNRKAADEAIAQYRAQGASR